MRGILPLRSRESCWKAGDGQTLPVPCFPENKGVIFREKEGGGKGAFPPPFLCFLLGTMLPAAVASADPAPTYSIKVEPSSIDLVEGESLPLKAIVTSDTGPLDEDGLKGAGLSIRWDERGHWPGKRGINRHPDHQSDGRKNRGNDRRKKGYHYCLSEQWGQVISAMQAGEITVKTGGHSWNIH